MTGNALSDVANRLSEEDELVLQCIDHGIDDVQRITEATRLDVDQVNYRFRKLGGELDWFTEDPVIRVVRNDGLVERTVNGTRQVFQAPKQAELTRRGREVFQAFQENRLEQYRRMSHDELAETVVELEDEFEKLELRFEMFREQVQDALFGDETEDFD